KEVITTRRGNIEHNEWRAGRGGRHEIPSRRAQVGFALNGIVDARLRGPTQVARRRVLAEAENARLRRIPNIARRADVSVFHRAPRAVDPFLRQVSKGHGVRVVTKADAVGGRGKHLSRSRIKIFGGTLVPNIDGIAQRTEAEAGSGIGNDLHITRQK